MADIHTQIVPRPWEPGLFALVKYGWTPDDGSDPPQGKELSGIIRDAVNETARSDGDLRELIEDTSMDFNVGDLSGYQLNDKLGAKLAARGIHPFEIEIIRSKDLTWTYDDILFDEDEIQPEDT